MNRIGNMGGMGAHRKVLVVEDSEFNRELLRTLLGDKFTIIEAENGLEGLSMLEKHYSDLSLVLLDVYMPECDGFEFLRRKRQDERFQSVPVIVTTASGAIEDEIRCLQLGAHDFVVKPYNFDIMMNRVKNMIHLRETASIVNRLTWDEATGLYSKEFFYRAVEETLEAFPARKYDVICSDIDNFKILNDRYGEKKCDLLLRDLAKGLSERLNGLVAGGRISGSSFAFLVEHKPQAWGEILNGMGDEIEYVNFNVKYGVVELVDHAMLPQQLCSRAISAIDTTRNHVGSEVAIFDDELHQRQLVEQIIRDSMEAALTEHQFSVFYQPKQDVHQNTVGGAEALVRWTHPTLGFVSPGTFIPIFERSGFITRLDYYVWEEACKEVVRCRDLGLPLIPISVNVSRIDFDETTLPKHIAELADKHGIDRSMLHVELTETAYSDNPERVTKMLGELRSLGFSVELDDFGSGYSSLASLNTLPLDVMKLDMSMVRMASELGDFRVVEASINLAKTLGLKTVVEGVETAEEASMVTAIGCDYIQGYYYSRPLSRPDFEEYLAKAGASE